MIPRTSLRLSQSQSVLERHVFSASLSSQKRHLAVRKAPSTRRKLRKEAPTLVTPEHQELKEREDKLKAAWSNLAKDMPLDWKIAVMNGNQVLASRLSNPIIAFIHDFHTSSMTQSMFEDTMNRNSVKVDDVYQATFLLRNLGSPEQAKFGRYLVRCCDKAGHTEATIQVVSSLLRQDMNKPGILRTKEAFLAQDRLQELWKNNNVAALVLGGKLAERRGDQDRAIEFYQTATDEVIRRSENPELYLDSEKIDLRGELSSPWMELGILHLRRGNQTKALEAYMIGIDQGDPMAHSMLSRLDLQFSGGEYSLDWLHHTTKAAATGHYKAAYSLAEYYANTRPPPPTQPDSPESDSTFFSRLGHFITTALIKPNIVANESSHMTEYAAAIQDPVARVKLAYEWLRFARDLTYVPALIQIARLHLRRRILLEDNLSAHFDQDGEGSVQNPLYSLEEANAALATVFQAHRAIQRGRREATTETQFRAIVGSWAQHPDVLEDYEANLDNLLDEARYIADLAGFDIVDSSKTLLYKHQQLEHDEL